MGGAELLDQQQLLRFLVPDLGVVGERVGAHLLELAQQRTRLRNMIVIPH